MTTDQAGVTLESPRLLTLWFVADRQTCEASLSDIQTANREHSDDLAAVQRVLDRYNTWFLARQEAQ